ncbi:FAD-binding oxidoreductase [bacterium]|nr:FAD-binding oxidoreductase [bacterium]
MLDHKQKVESWGRTIQVSQRSIPLFWQPNELPSLNLNESFLPFGEGRSYGDSCLNAGGVLLKTRGMSRFIEFDESQGILRCEAGVRLDEILELTLPKGWFIPVTPGTQFVTLGGAIANDVHGKNHHVAGTFGRYVRKMELLRSDGKRWVCSSMENPELFEATIAGLGLTGLILWAEIQMKPVSGPWINQETVRFNHVDDFFKISEDSETGYEYSVSWIDTLAQGKHLGRGHFMRGNHSARRDAPMGQQTYMTIPVDAPDWLLNPITVRSFNCLYYRKQWSREKHQEVHYRPFFYPLDSILAWNRLYGKRGFFQYQLVVPFKNDRGPIKEILGLVAKSGMASFLAVLKTFGNISSPGMLSFPREGVTLALDFPNQGAKTIRLFQSLDEIVRQSGGALYPAKDAQMWADDFKKFYPKWKDFQKWVDPLFSSSFWRRVTDEKAGHE